MIYVDLRMATAVGVLQEHAHALKARFAWESRTTQTSLSRFGGSGYAISVAPNRGSIRKQAAKSYQSQNYRQH